MRFVKRAVVAALMAAAIPFLAPGLAGNTSSVVGTAHLDGSRVTLNARGRGTQATGTVSIDSDGRTRRLKVACLMASGNEARLTAKAGDEAVTFTVIDSESTDELFFMETSADAPSCAWSSGTPQPISSGNYRVTGADGGGGGLSL